MPSGLNGFVQNRYDQKHGVAVSASEKERRRNIATSLKFKPTSSAKIPSQQVYPRDNAYSSNIALTQTNLAHVQSSSGDVQKSGDPFEGSILSNDTDDTLRDIHIGNQIQQQSLQYQDNQHKPRGGPFLEQGGIGRDQSMDDDDPNDSDGDDGYEEKEPDYIEEIVQKDNPAYMGMINSIRASVSNPALVRLTNHQAQERMRAFQQSEQYKQTRKQSQDTLDSSQAKHMFHGRSGRFTGLDIPQETKLVEEQTDHVEHNNDRSPDSLDYSDSNFPQTPAPPQERDTDYGRYSENLFGNREITEYTPYGKHNDEDTFEGADLASFSGQSSPTERTSRAHRHSVEQKLPAEEPVNKRTADDLDYDAATLSSMNYAQLKDQPFDNDPKLVPSNISEELGASGVSLEDRLNHFAGRTENERMTFFREMPIEDWEESGDWFLARFGDIISRLKDARLAKRRVSKTFEEELASREETVRGKTEEIKEVMRKMRAGGEGVLKGGTQ